MAAPAPRGLPEGCVSPRLGQGGDLSCSIVGRPLGTPLLGTLLQHAALHSPDI